MNIIKLIITVSCLAIFFSPVAQSAPSYTFTTLNSLLNDNSKYHIISDINDSGQILASSFSANSTQGISFILDGNSKTVFSDKFSPISLNNDGKAAGSYFDLATANRLDAGYWNGSSEIILGTLGGRNSFAADINNEGQIAGRSATAQGIGWFQDRATIWDGDKVIDLGVLRNAFKSEAVAINDKGQVIGSSNPQAQHHGVLWDDGKTIDMGEGSYLVDINNNGLIAGLYNSHATVWDNNKVLDLGTLGGAYSQADAINDNGVVVGYSDMPDFRTHAFIWDGGSIVDLNSLLDKSVIDAGWYLSSANHITESGMISGYAHNTITNESSSYIMNPVSPVPEPSTYMMLLVGLGMLTFAARRST